MRPRRRRGLDGPQATNKLRAVVFACARRDDAAAMQLDDRAADGEAEPEPAKEARARMLSLLKGVKDALHGLATDPDAAIAHFHDEVGV